MALPRDHLRLVRRPPGARGSATPELEPPLAQPAMHSRYGGILRYLFERLFGPLHYPKAAAESIRDLARRGTIVYVTRARSSLLALYFNHALERLGLPLARFVGGVNMLLWQPVDRLWLLWQQRRRPPNGPWRERFGATPPTRLEACLADTAMRGEPAFLFLQPPRQPGRPVKTEPHDFVRALVAVQRVTDRPIFLVPHALVSKTQGGDRQGTLGDRLFGARRNPGRLRLLAMFLGSLRHARVRVGAPIDLRAMCRAGNGAPGNGAPGNGVPGNGVNDALIARKVRHEVNRRINDEERVIAGPALPEYHSIERHVVRSEQVRKEIAAEAQRSGRTPASVEKRARGLLKKIAAHYDPRIIGMFSSTMSWVFNRIYDGVVVDEPGLERMIEASRSGPVMLCPSHKSHIDYLVLSYVLWNAGIAVPHIAAGANLSFFPLGWLFRRSGAFFMRRTFHGDPLYAAVFRAYVHGLVACGTTIEFFPEGTRSRTGKVLAPRFGMLSILVDAWRAGACPDVRFIPVSIDYERIIEAQEYERELQGEKKKPESIGGLLRTTRILRSRYGRVLLQFGDPISLAQIAERASLPQSLEEPDRWRAETERIGYRVLHKVATISSVTPTAVAVTALLGHHGRGLSESHLLARSEEIVDYLDAAAARLSDAVRQSTARGPAVLEAVRHLIDQGAIAVDRAGRSDAEPIYRVPDTNRVLLDYYKNALMNYFAPGAIFARCVRRRGGKDLRFDGLHQDSRFLSKLFKREFLYPVDATFESHFGDTVATLAVRGIIDAPDDGTVAVNDPERLDALASLLDSFVEAYWVTATTLRDLRAFPLWERELSLRALDRCRRAFLEGEIARPEAANRTLVGNAVRWMGGAGVITAETHGKRTDLRLAPEYAGAALDQLIDDIAAYL